MKFAIIENNTVVNVVVASEAMADHWVASEVAAIGDRYENGEFIKQPEPPAPVPEKVTMRQARLALLGAGLLSQVNATIASMPSPQKEAALIEWEYAATVERNSPLIGQLAPALGMTDAEMDQLFIGASLL